MKSIILLLLCHAFSSSFAQYKNLVFEGAGIRGIAYAGVVKALDSHGILDSIEKVGGTSAGAIIATTVALGYSSDDIMRITNEVEYGKFNDTHFGLIGSIRRIFKSYGWYRNNRFSQWIGEIIAAKTGDPDITFAGMRQLGMLDLYITGTSVNNQKLLVFSADSYPEMKVRDAVTISICVPFYFEAIAIDQRGQIVKNPKDKVDVDFTVDGGITACYPIFLFDEIDSSGFSMVRIPDSTTLGVRIDSELQIQYDEKGWGLAPRDVDNLGSFINALYIYTIENLNRNFLTESDWQRTISVSDGDIGPRIKELSEEQQNILVSNGIRAVECFLQKADASKKTGK